MAVVSAVDRRLYAVQPDGHTAGLNSKRRVAARSPHPEGMHAVNRGSLASDTATVMYSSAKPVAPTKKLVVEKMSLQLPGCTNGVVSATGSDVPVAVIAAVVVAATVVVGAAESVNDGTVVMSGGAKEK